MTLFNKTHNRVFLFILSNKVKFRNRSPTLTRYDTPGVSLYNLDETIMESPSPSPVILPARIDSCGEVTTCSPRWRAPSTRLSLVQTTSYHTVSELSNLGGSHDTSTVFGLSTIAEMCSGGEGAEWSHKIAIINNK